LKVGARGASVARAPLADKAARISSMFLHEVIMRIYSLAQSILP
jgi:hypothetical protein